MRTRGDTRPYQRKKFAFALSSTKIYKRDENFFGFVYYLAMIEPEKFVERIYSKCIISIIRGKRGNDTGEFRFHRTSNRS